MHCCYKIALFHSVMLFNVEVWTCVLVINAIVINGPWITGNYISMLDFTIYLTLGVNRINDQAETRPFIDAIDGHKSVQGKYLQLIILWVRGVINKILTWDGSVPGFFVYASAFPDPYGTFTQMVIILNLESGFKLNTTCSKTRDQDYDCIRLDGRMCCGSRSILYLNYPVFSRKGARRYNVCLWTTPQSITNNVIVAGNEH